MIAWCLLILTLCFCDPGPSEQVSAIPGYPSSYTQRVFSGYLSTGLSGRKLHYVFLEKKEINNTSPVTLWLNGGPGCSSKLGFLQEIPPYFLPLNTAYDSSLPLVSNPYTWLNLTNLLFIDSPAGVGYSINPDENYAYNDLNTAIDNYEALKDFFLNKFLEYKANAFYISGESYAGKYIPDLALRIKSDPENRLNLKGLFIGNGVTTFQSLEKNEIEFMISHNFIDSKLIDYYENSCKVDYDSAGCQYFFSRFYHLTDKIDPYNIYGPCEHGPTKSTQAKMIKRKLRELKKMNKESLISESITDVLEDCGYDKGVEDYFTANNDAFHAIKTNFKVCNEAINSNYKINPKGSMYEMAELLKNEDLKVYLYNGDWDDVVPFTDTIESLTLLGLIQNETMLPWIVNNQHAGFVRKYDRKLTFYTVKGAGHEVPQYQRERAFRVFEKFIYE